MSIVRIRVASSDWCASRIVVSVSSTRPLSFIHSAKSGWLITFSTNCRLVATPRIRNSRRPRSIRRIASWALGAQAVTLTSSES